MSEPYEIRIMAPSQSHEAAELEKLCFHTPWSEDAIRAETLNPDSVYICAMRDNVMLGYAGVKMVLDEGYITNVCVRPESRRNGIARELMRAAVRGARTRGLAFLTLEVRQSNSGAIALYSGLGFEKVGSRKNYYENPAEDADLMTLRFDK